MSVGIGINVGSCTISGVFVGGAWSAAARAAHNAGELASGLTSCLDDGSRRLGYPSARDMLRETDSVVVSTPAVGAGALREGSGPKMGLLVTRGLEEELLSGHISADGLPGVGIPVDMIESVDEEVDATGKTTREPRVDEVREAVRRLLQRGAETIVVSLRRSPLNPAHETKIREMIEHEYPPHYLGAVPVVLSVDHGTTLDDGQRTRSALLNAYCAPGTAKLLYEAEDVLRNLGFRGVLRVLDDSGGCARVCKTIPIACVGSDLAADRYVAAEIAAHRDSKEVVILDMGASDTRIGHPTAGEGAFSAWSPAEPSAPISAKSGFQNLGFGSHSVLAVEDGRMVLGPKRATPACYGLVDDAPTLTDAFVVLGLLNPDEAAPSVASGGAERARRAMESGVARPMGVCAEAAAELAVTQAVGSMASALREAVSRQGSDTADITLLALGGAGGVVCCHVAQELGVKEVYSPAAGWASGAFGALFAPVRYDYVAYGERCFGGDCSAADREWYRGVVRGLEERAVRGMRGEGLSADDLSFELELEVRVDGASAMVAAPLSLDSQGDVEELRGRCGEEGVAGVPQAGLEVRSFLLRAAGTGTSREPLAAETAGLGRDVAGEPDAMNVTAAPVGWRRVVMNGVPATVSVSRRESLKPGDVVTGPAVIQSRGDTCVVPDGMTCAVDELFGATISRVKNPMAEEELDAHALA